MFNQSTDKIEKVILHGKAYHVRELEKLAKPRFLLSRTPKLAAACGLFGISDDYKEDYQSLDERFNKNPESTFFFEAVGHSMEPTIKDKDLMLVDRSIESFHRRVCVVSYQGDFVCKRVILGPNGITLRSDNPSFKDIPIENNQEVDFWGVVGSQHGLVL